MYDIQTSSMQVGGHQSFLGALYRTVKPRINIVGTKIRIYDNDWLSRDSNMTGLSIIYRTVERHGIKWESGLMVNYLKWSTDRNLHNV